MRSKTLSPALHLKRNAPFYFALSFFAVPALWRISLPIFHKASKQRMPRPFGCGGGGYRGANRAAERQRKRNDRIRLFYRSSKNYRRRRFGGARTHPRKKRRLIRATLSPSLHLKRNASFYLHFPFSQSSPYGEYPSSSAISE